MVALPIASATMISRVATSRQVARRAAGVRIDAHSPWASVRAAAGLGRTDLPAVRRGGGGGQPRCIVLRSCSVNSFAPRSAALLRVQARIAECACSYEAQAAVFRPSVSATWVR